MKKKVLSMILALVMIISCLMMPATATSAAAQTSESPTSEAAIQAVYETPDGEIITEPAEKDTTEVEILVSVEDGETVFLQTSDLELAVASSDAQMNGLYAAESRVESALDMAIEIEHYYSLVFNGFAFKGESWMVDAINEIDGLSAMESPMFELIDAEEDETIDLTPTMDTATGMVGATNAWDLGYTGKGMVIAVIDTGIRQTHEAFSIAPEGAKIDEKYLEEVFEKYGSLMHCQNTEGAYYSAKLPYNWDYFDDDCIPNHTASDHGSHVAGIAAGNNGDDFKGIAPDAQIIPMQIFTKTGGAYISDMLASMEDCVYLGVDVINMSLGISNGFETYQWPSNFEPVYDALEKAGVAVCVSAGNEAHAYISTTYGCWGLNIWQWLAANPDNGHVGTPGTYTGSFTVGNTTNVARTQSAIFRMGATEIIPVASTKALPFAVMAAGEYEVVNVGYGTPEEIKAAGGVEGKIALAVRGGTYNDTSITFTAKCEYATAAGAAGILVYNNVPGNVTTAAESTIPFGSISQAGGQTIIAAMGSGNTTKITLDHGFSFKVATMVKSSSWGPTAQLSMKPDISAPGNKIISVDGDSRKDDSTYVSMTGTSMSSPAVAGGVLVMKQYLKTIFPNATGTELTEKAYALMMSTAGQGDAFVRQQGSGIMDLEKATKTTAYLTSAEDTRPKLELDDSETGEFDISFKVTNFGKTDKSYSVGLIALTEQTFTMDYAGNDGAGNYTNHEFRKKLTFYTINPTVETVWLANGTAKDVSSWCTLEGDKTVTVKAGETVTVNLTLKANQELMDYFKETCTSGMYLEGWIKLTDTSAENKVDLTIPYLGFVGDWDYPAMIDEGWWWQNEYGVNNMAQFYGSNGNRGGIYLGYGDAEQGLGLNYYWDETGETYLADRNALSPNGDGYLDALTTLEFSLLRQPRRVNIYIQHEDGTVETLYDKSYAFRREDHEYGASYRGLSYSGLYYYYGLTDMEENETATYVVEAYLDHDEFKLEDNKLAKLEIPFTKDTTAPVVNAIDGGVEIVDANYVAYYAIYTDARHTDMVFEDGVFAMERGAKETYMTDMDEYFVSVADYARNEAFYYVKDGVVYEMDAEGFDHGRTLIGQSHMKVLDADALEHEVQFAWYTFSENMDQLPVQQTEIVTESDDLQSIARSDVIGLGRTADGNIYASSMGYLYTFDPETFEKTMIGRYYNEGEKRAALYAFSVRPDTNELYGIVSYSGGVYSKTYFCSINPETAEITNLWAIKLSPYKNGFDFYDSDTIIMVKKYNERYAELINTADGTVESSFSMGNAFVGKGDGSKNRATVGAMYGYTEPILYDEKENCIYFGGCWSSNRDFRMDEQLVYKYDFDTGERNYFVPGYDGGVGLFGLCFLDEFVDTDADDCIYYLEEIAPTCTAEGYTLHTCADCGKQYRDNFIPALGHTYETAVTDPTCTDMGYTTYTCTVCGDSYVSDYVMPTEHPYTAIVIEPTCATAGYTMYVCDYCGDSYIDDVTDPVPHSYESYVVEPTCDDFGYTVYTCSVCGDSYVADYTMPYCPSAQYTDVTLDAWYHEAVDFVVENGLMNGMGDNIFAPNANMTRAQLVTVLYRLAGKPSVAGLENPFTDVAADAWYTDAVIWAANEGIVKGLTETTFAPGANVTREQLVTILYRYGGETEVDAAVLEGYADAANVSDWAAPAFAWAVENGIITGMTETTLAPQGNATRAQIATILMRYCEG